MSIVLIIEDDPNIASLISDRLKQEGFDTKIAYTGSMGLSHLENEELDCVTLDIHLPDIDGREILHKIRKESKKYLPVIVVTSDDTLKKEFEKYKIDGFLQKPIDFNKLKLIINLALKQKY